MVFVCFWFVSYDMALPLLIFNMYFYIERGCNVPTKCCSFQILFLILWCRTKVRLYILESVFAQSLLKMWKFSRPKGERTALISCVAMWLCTICACTHTIQVWGIVAFVLVRSFHNLQQINEIHLHTFCFKY